jgi:hypothetical protein
VLTYRCPGCGKQHVLDKPFDEPFVTRCLRCGETFAVTEESLHEGGQFTAKQPGKPGRSGEESAPRGRTTATPPSEDKALDPATATARTELDIDTPNEEEPAESLLDDDDPLALAEGTDLEPMSDEEERAPRPLRFRKPRDKGKKGRKPKGPPRKGSGMAGSIWDEDDVKGEEDEEAAPPPERPKYNPYTPEAPAEGPPWWKRWQVLAGLAGGLLLVVGLGVYLFYPRGTTPKQEASTTKPPAKTSKPSTAASGASSTAKTATSEVAVKPKEIEPTFISSARLGAELAANAEEANRKYEKATLVVSGPFSRMEAREGGTRSFAVFSGDVAPISCDLANSRTDKKLWDALKPEQGITVRGTYVKGGSLENCELLPLTPPANAKYLGKEVELTGIVDAVLPPLGRREFPQIELELDTNAKVKVECRFPKSANEEIQKVQPGTPVTIKGTCAGRFRFPDGDLVRLENCKLVDTSAPTAPTVRLPAIQFQREYEEDLRGTLRPDYGTEPKLEKPVTVFQLAKELAADSRNLEKNYRHRIVIISGRLAKRPGADSLFLESDDTGQVLKVQCFFTTRAFKDKGERLEFSVRGLCTGMEDAQTVRLDNCEFFDPEASKDPRRLTTDYLPHVPGRVMTYDLVDFPLPGNGAPTAARMIYTEREGGTIETVVSHLGTLVGKSLFDAGEQARWVAQKRTQKVKLPGLVFHRRVSGGFVEIGQRVAMKADEGTQRDIVWQPVLKLQARKGDTWKWSRANEEHQYALTEFKEDQGRTYAIIKEVIVRDGDADHPFELRHVYLHNVGEVERQVWQQLTTKDKKIMEELKLVEDVVAPGKDTKPMPPK